MYTNENIWIIVVMFNIIISYAPLRVVTTTRCMIFIWGIQPNLIARGQYPLQNNARAQCAPKVTRRNLSFTYSECLSRRAIKYNRNAGIEIKTAVWLRRRVSTRTVIILNTIYIIALNTKLLRFVAKTRLKMSKIIKKKNKIKTLRRRVVLVVFFFF